MRESVIEIVLTLTEIRKTICEKSKLLCNTIGKRDYTGEQNVVSYLQALTQTS